MQYKVTIKVKDKIVLEMVTSNLEEASKILEAHPEYTSFTAEPRDKTKVKKYYPKNKSWSSITG